MPSLPFLAFLRPYTRTWPSSSPGRCAIAGTAALLLLPVPSTAIAQEQGDSIARRTGTLEAVVVSATRTERAASSLPVQVVVLGQPAIATSTAQTVPDLLRTIPGFTTRDFQAGVVSGPSQSIVSFRGLGGSSAGRTLVLLDGLPAGDPFSGWLDWGRIPLQMLASAEVIRGGGSITWGSRSLGGVVNLRTVAPRRDEVRVTLEGGSFGTYHGSGMASLRRGRLSAVVGGDYRDTDGFVILRADQAGPADVRESRTNRTLTGRVTYDVAPALQAWIGGSTFTGGNRPLGIEDEYGFDEGRGGLRWLTPAGGILTAALFTNRRTSIGKSWSFNDERTAKSPQRDNRSPARSTGLSLQWTRMVHERHELTAGVDITSATGSFSEQSVYENNEATLSRAVGGTQRMGGLFVQDAADLGRGIHMVASARVDRVQNVQGRRSLRDLVQGTTLLDTAFSDAVTHRLTGSFGLRWQQSDWLAWRGSVYEAFRAPSMYEMYYARFSSSGTVTEANAALAPERLTGAEVGADLTLANGLLTRVTVFTNRVASPIMDITIGRAGDQAEVIAPCGLMPAGRTCSQRQNVSGLRSSGIEAKVDWRTTDVWNFGAGYSYTPTRVIAPGEPADGMQAIRSPRHMLTTSAVFDNPRWFTVALEARYVGSRYNDDVNEIKLDGFPLVGLRVNRELGRGMTAHLKIDNLLDEAFEVERSRSGLADMGAPRWITLGVRAIW